MDIDSSAFDAEIADVTSELQSPESLLQLVRGVVAGLRTNDFDVSVSEPAATARNPIFVLKISSRDFERFRAALRALQLKLAHKILRGQETGKERGTVFFLRISQVVEAAEAEKGDEVGQGGGRVARSCSRPLIAPFPSLSCGTAPPEDVNAGGVVASTTRASIASKPEQSLLCRPDIAASGRKIAHARASSNHYPMSRNQAVSERMRRVLAKDANREMQKRS
jgi:hypothetical protein